MHHARFGSAVCLAAASLWLLDAPALRAQTCPGDCNGDGTVSLTELAVAERALFGTGVSAADCPAADTDGDGAVTVDEAVAAARAAGQGCGTPPPASAAVGATAANGVLETGTATGAPGSQVSVDVVLHTNGQSIAGTQQDIAFDADTPITSCTRNTAINENGTAFGFQPPGCTVGVDCTAVRALVFSFQLALIPDGAVLFTCTVDIAPTAAAGVHPLVNSRFEGSTADGQALALDVIDGAVVVEVPTPTPPPAPASLILEKVRLKADTARSASRHNGSLSVRAVVNANAPFAHFVDDLTATGLSLHVSGAGGADLTLAWQAGECRARNTARGPRVDCAASDAGGKRKAKFQPVRVPNLFRAHVTARGIDLSPPLAAEPVTVVLSTASFERGDDIDSCRVRSGGRAVSCKESGVVPTATPTPVVPTPTPTPTLPNDTTIVVSNALGVPGGTSSFTVGLETNASIAGTENEIQFDASAPLAFVDCQVDPSINKSLFLSLRPTSCIPGTNCTAMKGIVINLANLDPIPNGSTMYSCDVAVFASAVPGDYLIDCFNPGASDPVGNAIPTQCSDGTFTVSAGP